MSDGFVILFIAFCVFLYAPRDRLVTRRDWAAHILVCILCGYVLGAILITLDPFDITTDPSYLRPKM